MFQVLSDIPIVVCEFCLLLVQVIIIGFPLWACLYSFPKAIKQMTTILQPKYYSFIVSNFLGSEDCAQLRIVLWQGWHKTTLFFFPFCFPSFPLSFLFINLVEILLILNAYMFWKLFPHMASFPLISHSSSVPLIASVPSLDIVSIPCSCNKYIHDSTDLFKI